MNNESMRETPFLKCLFSLTSALRLPRLNVYKYSQNITKNQMGWFAIKYFNAFKKHIWSTSYMLGTVIITTDNLVTTTPDSYSLLETLPYPWEPCATKNLFKDWLVSFWSHDSKPKPEYTVNRPSNQQPWPANYHTKGTSYVLPLLSFT